jgi:hypothetical protein
LRHAVPLSPQDVPFALNPLAGQSRLTPSQVSATSQTPFADRQTVADGTTASGHADDVPSQ